MKIRSLANATFQPSPSPVRFKDANVVGGGNDCDSDSNSDPDSVPPLGGTARTSVTPEPG